MTERQVNIVRDKVQRSAVKSIENNKGRGLLAMATGSGKSKIPIMYAKKKKNKVKTIALIVPTERLRDEGWHDEFVKWGVDEMWTRVVRLCYASASKVKDQKFDLVILDECHNITELSSVFFIDNECRDVIALTATEPSDPIKQYLLLRIGLEVTYKLTLDEAVKMGFVAPYRITIGYTQLDNVNKTVKAGSKENPFYQTEYANYIWINNQMAIMDFEGKASSARYKTFALKRMRAIYNLESKTNIAKMALSQLDQEDRVLIFCGSVEQAEKISEYTYHSKDKKNSKVNLDKFIKKEINELSCVKRLNEGENLPDLDKAIIVQLNSQEKDLVQRIGRLIRYRPGHIAHILILVAKNTQDEVWLASALENIDKSIIDFKYF